MKDVFTRKATHDQVCVFCAKRQAVAMHMRWPVCAECATEHPVDS